MRQFCVLHWDEIKSKILFLGDGWHENPPFLSLFPPETIVRIWRTKGVFGQVGLLETMDFDTPYTAMQCNKRENKFLDPQG